MLPGLSVEFCTDTHLCTPLSKLTKDISHSSLSPLISYLNRQCLKTCHNEITYRFYSAMGLPADTFAASPNPRMRALAARLTTDQEIVSSLCHDPSGIVRQAAIARLGPSADFVEFLDDCSEIKLIALDKLTSVPFLSKTHMNDINLIFSRVAAMINDIDPHVRCKAAAKLRHFTMVSTDRLIGLLSKKDAYDEATLGSFIHGLEDECYSVRVNTIESMCLLTSCVKMANAVFDFLTHLLNDGMEHVKEAAALNMLSMAMRFRIQASSEMLDLIFYNFEEKNDCVKNVLYETLIHLSYDEEMILYVYEKLGLFLTKNVDRKKIFYILKNLVRVHPLYFQARVRFQESLVLSREPALNDNVHYCKVIILGELLRSGLHIKYPKAMEKHLFYYRLKEAVNGSCSIDLGKKRKVAAKGLYADFMINMIDELKTTTGHQFTFDKYASLFCSTVLKTENDRFYGVLYNALRMYYLKGSNYEFTKMNVLYGLNADIKGIKQVCLSSESFTAYKFAIHCLRKVGRRLLLPLRFEVGVYYELKDTEKYYLRVKSKDLVFYHEMQQKLTIYIYEKMEKFALDIVYKDRETVIGLVDAIEIVVT